MLEAAYSRHLLVSDLCNEIEEYLPKEQVSKVYDAYLFGAEAHDGQTRKSGEPYIYHPLEVASILSKMQMDYQCLIAAILHDVLEDTDIEHAAIVEQFGAEIADTVEGVTKLDKLTFKSKAEAQAASFRKMFLAMTKDIRVIIIKLADRLHNMRTIGVMRADQKYRIGKETLEIYAPIANRLGMNVLRQELEDLSMEAIWPWRTRIIKQTLEYSRHEKHQQLVQKIGRKIKKRLEREHINAKVTGREKRPYSIYRKMLHHRLPFKQLADVFSFQVVTKNTNQCYLALGIIHNLYKPKPGCFKDIIALPRDNGYQSLHTHVLAKTLSIEIQIRDRAMHRFAQTGIAAHWKYKTGENGANCHFANHWQDHLKELNNASETAEDLLEQVKIDLFPNEVFVFTPKAKIIVLPRGATVLDFAYAVHTDIGNQCVAATVDYKLVPLKTALYNGQVIDIHINKNSHPRIEWLNYVVTPKARGSIRQFFKKLKKDQAERLGKELFEYELARIKFDFSALSTAQIDTFLNQYHYQQLNDLYHDIGLGNAQARLIAHQLQHINDLDHHHKAEQHPLVIKNTEGLVIHFAHCCYPIPGDPVIAHFTVGKGLVVHHQFCHNLCHSQKKGDCIDIQWAQKLTGEFMCQINIEVKDEAGVLAIVANIIANAQSNIENLETQKTADEKAYIKLKMKVKSHQHYQIIAKKLTESTVVKHVKRVVE